MKVIGLIGGMSYESTIPYYEIINDVIKKELGGLHSSKCILYSVNFHEIEECQATGNWSLSAEILGEVAKKLELAGAEYIVICTNTMHKVADIIGSMIKIPILHITDPTIKTLEKNNIKRVGLLGTKYTMEDDFYKSRLINKGIDVIIPKQKDINIVQQVIYEELCLGIINPSSKQKFLNIMNDLVENGAEGIILGCTEIGLLIKQEDTKIPLFDTTYIHAEYAALKSIEKEEII